MGNLGSGYAWLKITQGYNLRWYHGTGQWNDLAGGCVYSPITPCLTTCYHDVYYWVKLNGQCQTDYLKTHYHWYRFSWETSDTKHCLLETPQGRYPTSGICYESPPPGS